jgi:hypothetical protein
MQLMTSKEKRKEYARKYYQEHKEFLRNQCASWRKNNPEKWKESWRKSRKKHPESVKLYSKRFYDKNGPEYFRQWKLKNKESVNSRRRSKSKTIHARILNSLSSRVRGMFKLKKIIRTQSKSKLIGCSPEELKLYLASKFQEGMSWDNYGKYAKESPMTWHIDHIIPCSSFDLTDPEQQKKCFHYTNLQPLWAVDNMSKHDKLL